MLKEVSDGLFNILIGTGITALMMLAGFLVFSLITKYDDIQEIKNGNKAAGIYMGSKLLGLGIIIAFTSYSSHSWVLMLVWGAVGIIVQSLIYIVFDRLTPRFKVCEEIKNGNEGVARLFQGIIIGISIVVGTFIL